MVPVAEFRHTKKNRAFKADTIFRNPAVCALYPTSHTMPTPASGFPIVRNGKWYTVGGTSAGAPQWAAIAALGSGATDTNFYSDKAGSDNAKYFTDVTSGTNGSCGYVCVARKNYDYVTGLGTPVGVKF